MCAHNSRIYNRSINTIPEILDVDKITPTPNHTCLYQLLLTMKYLMPSDYFWQDFILDLKQLISVYEPYIDLTYMNIPDDWENHLIVS